MQLAAVVPSGYDFHPVLVEIFCRAIRRMNSSDEGGEELVFSEMLPGPQQQWLKDAKGSSYTSELRLRL